ncbi:MAG: MFS transporter [Planctomycetota bacterium]|nr:MFS transporter [Planctomycetota bacterium]
MLRWRIALMISVAIAISYLDRQTLPVCIKAISHDIPISNQLNAFLNSAFLLAYGAMYLGGGRLMDFLGTRRGFAIIMFFWSLACASHGFASNVYMLAASRLMLGMGEGGGFPAATRAVAEWFPVRERSSAMGIINAGTGVGGVIALPLIAMIVSSIGWLGIAHWRWVFFLTGAMGLAWTLWWIISYEIPDRHSGLGAVEREKIRSVLNDDMPVAAMIPLREILSFVETWAIIVAKFLTDAAWYFYLFWLPKYLYDSRGFDIKAVGKVAWIPYAASGVGCLCGGWLSSTLLRRGYSVNLSRKVALGASAALMPCVIAVPFVSVSVAIALFSIAFFGQQSWSTLIMVLPTDLFPKRAVGTVAGLVGFGGAIGGVVLGQLAGYLLDHGFSYRPVLAIAGSLHVMAFIVILVGARRIRQLPLGAPAHGFEVIQEQQGTT